MPESPAAIGLKEEVLQVPPPPPDPTDPFPAHQTFEPMVEAEAPVAAEVEQVPESARRFERNLALLRALKHGSWNARRQALSAVEQFPPGEQEEFKGLRKMYGVND